jgi:hypothetical protein
MNWSNTGKGQPLTLEAFRVAREKFEEQRKTIPPRHRQIVFLFTGGELVVPPNVWDVLMRYGVNDEGSPAWTPAELDVILAELEEACQK